MPANTRSITVLGAGILGLWQALTLARAGHRVRLVEASAEPFTDAASLYAAVMLAPEREAETAPAMLRQLGREGVALWRNFYPALKSNGSLVVAAARERGELRTLCTAHAGPSPRRCRRARRAGARPCRTLHLGALLSRRGAHAGAGGARVHAGRSAAGGCRDCFRGRRRAGGRRDGHRLPRPRGARCPARPARRARRACR